MAAMKEDWKKINAVLDALGENRLTPEQAKEQLLAEGLDNDFASDLIAIHFGGDVIEGIE
jgi:hypothetical protein